MRGRPPRFRPDALHARLARLRPGGRLWVAYSGGADSTALLLALAELRPRLEAELRAVHVNHGIHPRADAWEARCRATCATLEIPYRAQRLPPIDPKGAGTEAELRRLRYAALESLLEHDDLLVTAHHRDDQAETMLLNLVRGSGPAGLAGMPGERRLGQGRLQRPLLVWSRADLCEWLEQQGVDWIEDDGNQDTTYDRNFLRHEVLPLLRHRWPAIERTMARSADHCREAATLLDSWSALQLAGARVVAGVLAVPGDLGGDLARAKQLIRHWLKVEGAPSLPGARLEEFCRQLLSAAPDAQPSCRWADRRLHYWNRHLWLRAATAEPRCPERAWRTGATLALGPRLGSLSLGPSVTGRVGLRVRARAAGDAMRLPASGHRRSVKELLRSSGIPPWSRAGVPILVRDGNPLAVGDWAVSPELSQWLERHDARLAWTPADPQLAWLRQRCHDAPVASDRPVG